VLGVLFPKVLDLVFEVCVLVERTESCIADFGLCSAGFFGTKKLVNVVCLVQPLAIWSLFGFNFARVFPVSESGC
jgi:hypothetical protein